MTVLEFAKECSSMDNPVGDLSRDILSDRNFPSNKSEKEIKAYLNEVSLDDKVNDAIRDFFTSYKKAKI